jgi:transposase-like protein
MRRNTKPWERERWVREWRRSKLSARGFCEKHGLRPATLYMWARAGSSGEGGRSELVALPRLVEAIPVDRARADAEWRWELECRGVVLRGRDLDTAVLAELVSAMTRTGR